MDKCYVMDMLTVLYYALRQEAEGSLPFSLASLISEVRSVLGVCFTNASKSTISSLADRRLLVMIVFSCSELGLGLGLGWG